MGHLMTADEELRGRRLLAGPGEDGPPYMLANTPEELERAKRVAFRQLDAEAARLAGPGGDARAEAREQIARALWESASRLPWDLMADTTRDAYRTHAVAVLAVPAVAEALALRGRVEALYEEMRDDGTRISRYDAAADLRRALDGDGQ